LREGGTVIVSAPRMVVGDAVLAPGAVVVEGGIIQDVLGHRPPHGRAHLALEYGMLTPGLVDLQVNGAFGVDFATAADADWDHVTRQLCRTGVTSFQPTFVTAPLDELTAQVRRVATVRSRLGAQPVAQILGAHLEGPFLSPAWPGVHDARLMIDPDPDAVELLLTGPERPTMVTLAPERPGAMDAIRRLVEAGVRVALGHTDALSTDISAAADAGATCITHLFNAQRPLGHREPGVPGQALADPRFTLGLIADLHHVAPQISAIVLRAAPGRVAVVTDATAAAGMPAGSYRLGDVTVHVPADGEPPRRADGRLAGSSLTMDAAVRNLVSIGVDVVRAVDAAGRAPADALGRPDLGRIRAGAVADVVWWSDDLRPLRTWVRGVEE
jgi:N-acetylglucosamine-6-phosphate deacetylase